MKDPSSRGWEGTQCIFIIRSGEFCVGFVPKWWPDQWMAIFLTTSHTHTHVCVCLYVCPGWFFPAFRCEEADEEVVVVFHKTATPEVCLLFLKPAKWAKRRKFMLSEGHFAALLAAFSVCVFVCLCMNNGQPWCNMKEFFDYPTIESKIARGTERGLLLFRREKKRACFVEMTHLVNRMTWNFASSSLETLMFRLKAT